MNIDSCWYKDVCRNDCNSCLRYKSMLSMCQKSGLPESMWIPKTLTTNEEDLLTFKKLATIKSSMVDFVKNGRNIYIFSDICGNGKSSWAIKLLLSYFDDIWHTSGFNCKGIFLHTPTFLTQYKNNISKQSKEFEELRDNILKCDVVIWDDIASTKLSDYDYNVLLTYIDQRMLSNKSNIFTGNCDEDKCEEYLGQRLKSRIFSSDFIFELKEQDKRGTRI